MSDATLPLLQSRRFLPLFITQFLGAANDNLFKNGIGILIIYRLLADDPAQSQLLVSAAAGIFILPYMLFSSIAGELADRMEKSRLMQFIKVAEICIMILGAAGLYIGNPYLLLAVLFLLGVHSTFFGPLKYSVLPQHLRPEEMIAGNALVEGGTFVAILLGTIVGGLMIPEQGALGPLPSALLIGVACCGLLSSLFLPKAAANQPGLRIDWNLWRGSRDVIRTVTAHREVNLSVIGISWFWAVGAAYLGQLPAFAKEILAADNQVVTLMLTMFSVGIAVGSIVCDRLLKGEVSARYTPYAMLGMALFTLDLFFSGGTAARSGPEIGVGTFVSGLAGLHVLIDLFLIAVCGGIFTVPLYTILQSKSDPRERARAVAANNILNSIYIVAGSIVVIALLKLGTGVTGVFAAAAIGNLIVGLWALKLVKKRNVNP